MSALKISAEQCRRRLRAEMPAAAKWAYFDHAAVAPLSQPARLRLQQYAEDCAVDGARHWPLWAREIESSRLVAAEMINARPEEVAWVANTTSGIGLVAEGLDWRDGDNLVTLANEFPSNLFPWLNLAPRGVEVRRRRPAADGRWTVDELLSECDSRTRLISVSWVGYASGFRCDVPRLAAAAHGRGIRLLIDGIQGLGVFPLDVRATPIDFLAADGHKWMLGPEGAGLLYVAADALDALRPLNVGWNSVKDRYEFGHAEMELRREASRYEGGSQNMPGVLALGASLRLLQQCGHGPAESAVGRAVRDCAELLERRLESLGARVVSARGDDHGSGIVSFELPGQDPAAVRKRCLQREVVVSCRSGRLRASPHAYTTEQDIDRLCQALRA